MIFREMSGIRTQLSVLLHQSLPQIVSEDSVDSFLTLNPDPFASVIFPRL